MNKILSKIKYRCVAAILFCCCTTFFLDAEETDSVKLRTTMNAVTFQSGGAHNLDTYLSPIRYSGMNLAIDYEFMRAAKFAPKEWIHQVNTRLNYDNTENPVKNNTLHALSAHVGWRMAHRRNNVAKHGLNLFFGGTFDFDGGVTYNPRNSNNVCSPSINLNIGVMGMATYNFKLGKLPLTARYQAVIPVVGCFYLPDYDQSFYEIYHGNLHDAINFGYWGNRFDITNLVTLDFRFKNATLRMGYRNECTTIWKNNISVQRTTHSLVFGVAWETIKVNYLRGLPKKAEIISALY